MSLKEKEEHYEQLLHAMQTGVLHTMRFELDKFPTHIEYEEKSATGRKHLRTGVNSTLIESSALVLALERKGIITHEEIMDTMIELLEEEVKRYEEELSKKFGTQITLG